MSTPRIIDPAALEALQGLNPGDEGAFVREVVGIFLADTPERIAALDTALLKGDVTALTREAHSIKGSSANVGATALRAAAEELEQRAKREGPASLPPGIQRLKNEFAAAKAELELLTKQV